MDAPVLLLRDPSRSLVSEYSLKKGSGLNTDLTFSYDVPYTVNPFHPLTATRRELEQNSRYRDILAPLAFTLGGELAQFAASCCPAVLSNSRALI